LIEDRNEATERRQSDIVRVTWWAALLLVLLILAIQDLRLIRIEFDRSTLITAYTSGFSIYAFDIPLVALAIVQRRETLARLRAGGQAIWASATFVGLLAVATLVHPSVVGLERTTRWALAFVLVFSIHRAVTFSGRRIFLRALAGVCLLEVLLAIAQILHQDNLGLVGLGERPELTRINGSLAASGTFHHPYYLAAFSLIAAIVWSGVYLATRSPAAVALAGISILPLGLTFSRAGAVAAVASLVTLSVGVAYRRQLVVPIMTIVVCLGIAGLANLDDWRGRASQPLDYDTGGRVELTDQGVELLKHHPLLGVGPGLYGVAATDDLRVPFISDHPVHNVPILIAVEAGVLAGLISIAALIALLARAARGWHTVLALFLGYLPFLMLDHFPYDHPQGIVLTALWAGAILALSSESSPLGPPDGREAPARAG
jgi:O-antigen ligase/polysaccharide polymerase Wzy-like membrane protein